MTASPNPAGESPVFLLPLSRNKGEKSLQIEENAPRFMLHDGDSPCGFWGMGSGERGKRKEWGKLTRRNRRDRIENDGA